MSTAEEGAEGTPSPTALVAVTTKDWLVPFSRPSMSQEVAGAISRSTEQVLSGSEAGHAVYAVIGEPLAEGALQETVAPELRAVAVTEVGAPGGARGATGSLAIDSAPTPTALTAVTMNAYSTPLVNPSTTHPSMTLTATRTEQVRSGEPTVVTR